MSQIQTLNPTRGNKYDVACTLTYLDFILRVTTIDFHK